MTYIIKLIGFQMRPLSSPKSMKPKPSPFFVHTQQSLDFSSISNISHLQQVDHTINLNISQIQVIHDDAEQWDLGNILAQVTVMNEIPEQVNESSIASTDETVLETAQLLKEEVQHILESYARQISQNELRAVRKAIPEDTKRISVKLDELLQMKQKMVRDSKQINTIIKLVQDFLANFSQMKKRRNSTLQQEKLPPQVSYASDEQLKNPQKLLDSLNAKIIKLTNELQGKEQFKELVLQFASNNDPVANFSQIRALSDGTKEVKKIVKACYLKSNLLQEESSFFRSKESTCNTVNSLNITKDVLKRKFYDFAVGVKFNLPKDHPAQKIMISQLYEMAQEVPEEEWENFIKRI